MSSQEKMEGAEATRIMIGVNESTIKGYPHASISSRGAFDWALQKIVRSNTSGFKLLFLHVQVPDEDGSLHLPVFLLNKLNRIYSTVWVFVVRYALELGFFIFIYIFSRKIKIQII